MFEFENHLHIIRQKSEKIVLTYAICWVTCEIYMSNEMF